MPETSDLGPLRRALLARHGPAGITGIDPALERSARISLPGALPEPEGIQTAGSPDLFAQAITERTGDTPEGAPVPERDEEAMLILKVLIDRLKVLNRRVPASNLPSAGPAPPEFSASRQTSPALAGPPVAATPIPA